MRSFSSTTVAGTEAWEIISELSSRFAIVRGLNLMRNYGQHNALLCGIRAAKYDVIVTMDDDLQGVIRPKKSRDCSNNWNRDSTLFMARLRKNGTGLCALLLPALRGWPGKRHRNGSRQERECVPCFPYSNCARHSQTIKLRLFPSTCC